MDAHEDTQDVVKFRDNIIYQCVLGEKILYARNKIGSLWG